MKTRFVTGLCVAMAVSATAATSINAVNRYSYGANIGWMDWRGDVNNGAVIGEFICSGFIYAANVGWINLGNGAPANDIRYANNSADDFGVNHDGAGRLFGLAWGANIGWLNFTNRDGAGASFAGPRVDLASGRLSGFVWSANCGWISLSNAIAFVQTDSLPSGPDVDGDGLPDAWEQDRTGDLTTLNAAGDNDSDGFSNAQEYLADSDPTDPASGLRITFFNAVAEGTANTITWTSRPTRQYLVQERDDLTIGFTWTDAGLGLISPDAGLSTTRAFGDAPAPYRFFRVEALRPLAP